MPVYIALLRGINVSGHHPLKMDRLRDSFAALGFSEVKTYVQSGNVVFTAAKATTAGLAKKITEKIFDDFDFTVSVLVRTPAELGAILGQNPLLKQAGIDESKLHVTFLAEPAPTAAEARLKPLAVESERCLVRGREVYLYCPDGYGRTKLSNAAIERKLSTPATTRNWRTVRTLLEMAGRIGTPFVS